MNCPYCSSETEEGYVTGGKGVYWLKNDRGVFLFPSKAKGDIVIMGEWSGNGGGNAYLCRKCNKIIIDLK